MEKESKIVPSDSYVRFLSLPAPKPAPDHLKTILADYTITQVLGSGAFADVYGGTDAHGNNVAIKIPQMKLDATIDSSIIDNFEKETEMWKNLEHPNIVTIYSADNQPLPHIVMEMMDGGSLQSLIKHHKLTVGETVNIMLQVLEALSYSHRMATVHRDLKPENILFTNDGVAKITDWGIGKFMASTALKQTMGIKGTLAYSAPEQFDNKKYGKVDWQTDIFQVGVVFYEMLTGVNPYDGDGMAEVVGKVMIYEPQYPSSFNPNVPNKLDSIVMGALVKEKADRWRTDVMLFQLKELVKERTMPIEEVRTFQEPKEERNQVVQYNQAIQQHQVGGKKPFWCPNCGSELEPEWHFCPVCHTMLSKMETNNGRNSLGVVETSPKLQQTVFSPKPKPFKIKKESLKQKKRSKKVGIISVFIIVLLIAGGIGFYYLYGETDDEITAEMANKVSLTYFKAIRDPQDMEYVIVTFDLYNGNDQNVRVVYVILYELEPVMQNGRIIPARSTLPVQERIKVGENTVEVQAYIREYYLA